MGIKLLIGGLSIFTDIIRVLNFCKSCGCKMIYFYGVHLSSYLYLYWSLFSPVKWKKKVIQSFQVIQSFFSWIICLLIYWSSLYILGFSLCLLYALHLFSVCGLSSLSVRYLLRNCELHTEHTYLFIVFIRSDLSVTFFMVMLLSFK